MVRAATPDVVLAGVEVLADGSPDDGVEGAGDVLVVDIGGATTDVYSVITPDGEDATLILFGPDYDGTHKARVRFADGRDAIVGGSAVERLEA